MLGEYHLLLDSIQYNIIKGIFFSTSHSRETKLNMRRLK